MAVKSRLFGYFGYLAIFFYIALIKHQVADAAVGLLYQEITEDNEDTCIIKDFTETPDNPDAYYHHIKIGTEAFGREFCSSFTCDLENSSYLVGYYETCGVAGAVPPCYVTEEDLTKPYPYCCRGVKCPDNYVAPFAHLLEEKPSSSYNNDLPEEAENLIEPY